MVPVEGTPGIIEVPGDFGTIQAAIDAANPGDIVQVASGTYNESVTVNKPVTLVGENSNTTIISGRGAKHVVYVTANNVNISGLTIRDGLLNYRNGIWLERSNDTNISGNIITNNFQGIILQGSNGANINSNIIVNNQHGIGLTSSDNNIISDNTVSNNLWNGINLQSDSDENIISGNTVSHNEYGVYILGCCDNNTVYHNNVISNTHQAASVKVNMWDNGYPSGGNYWSDYTGNNIYSGPYQNETGNDGIGDTPYVINDDNRDRYPLMYQWPDTTSPTTTDDYDGQWHNTDFTITLTAVDDKSGTKETYYRINGGTTKTVNTNGQPLITTEDANNMLEYWSIDNVDNEEIPHKILTDIKLDKTAPSGSIIINNNDANTTTLNVTLDLWASDATSGVSQMRLKNGGANWTLWETYATPKAWNLLWNEGTKTTYIQYQDVAGLISPIYNDTIIVLDVTSPTTTASMSGVEGNNGWFTSNVTVTLTATDDISGVNETKYSFDNATWTTYTTTLNIITQGSTVIYYKSTDKAGNVETIKSQTIKIDKIVPSGSIKINNDDAYATSISVTLNLNATDVGSSVYQARFSNDGVWDTESWEAYSPTKTWTLTLGDGAKTVYLQIRDKAGLVSNTYSDTIILDITPPTGSITIDGGATYTMNTSVSLTLSATDETSGVAEMRFSNDNINYTEWQINAASKSWILQEGDGTKTVYVQFRDQAGLVSTYFDTIIFDISPPTGSIMIAEGLAYTKSASVILTISADDDGSGVFQMCFSHDNTSWTSWEAYSVSKAWILITGDGEKTVYVQFKDNMGLISQSYSDMIVLDTAPPSGSITIAEGSVYTSTTSVTLTLSADDETSGVAQMRFRQDDNLTWTLWEPYAVSKAWVLTAGDGTKTVYYQIRDNAGLESETYSDSIFLDATKPSVGTLSQDPPESQVQPNQKVTVSVEVSDGQSGVREVFLRYRYSADEGQTWTAWANVPMNKIMGDTYAGEISGFIIGIMVEYSITAYDHANNAATKDNVGQYYLYEVIPEFSTWITILAMFCIFSVTLLLLRRNRNKRRVSERLRP